MDSFAACGKSDFAEQLAAKLGGEEVLFVATAEALDGELKYPIEQHPAATGTAPIETEHELVEVASQVRVVDGALMGAQQPPLGQ